jgi:hypothetical protein
VAGSLSSSGLSNSSSEAASFSVESFFSSIGGLVELFSGSSANADPIVFSGELSSLSSNSSANSPSSSWRLFPADSASLSSSF